MSDSSSRLRGHEFEHIAIASESNWFSDLETRQNSDKFQVEYFECKKKRL